MARLQCNDVDANEAMPVELSRIACLDELHGALSSTKMTPFSHIAEQLADRYPAAQPRAVPARTDGGFGVQLTRSAIAAQLDALMAELPSTEHRHAALPNKRRKPDQAASMAAASTRAASFAKTDKLGSGGSGGQLALRCCVFRRKNSPDMPVLFDSLNASFV